MLFGQCPNRGGDLLKGASLRYTLPTSYCGAAFRGFRGNKAGNIFLAINVDSGGMEALQYKRFNDHLQMLNLRRSI